MSDLISVGRLAFARSRMILFYSIVYLVAIHLVANLVWQLFPRTANLSLYSRDLPQYIFGFLGFGSLPLIGVAIVIFGFEEEANLDEQGTSFPPWLLRTPVASWKLAVIPLLLKTAWVVFVFSAIAATGWMMESPVPHWFVSSVAVAVLPIWFCSLMWSSFRWRYTRFALAAVSFVPCFLWAVYCTAYAFVSPGYGGGLNEELIFIDQFAPLIAFGSWGVFGALSAFALFCARSNVLGKIPETRFGFLPQDPRQSTCDHATVSVNELRLGSRSIAAPTPARALLRYDLALIKRLSLKYALAAWMTVLGIACLVDGVSIAGLIFLTVVLCFIAGFASEGAIFHSEQGTTPNLIRSAPIATATLAWTRQAFVTLIRFIVLLGLPIAVLAWWATGVGNAMQRSYEQSLGFLLGPSASVPAATLAIAIILSLLVARHSTWSVALLSSRNQRTGLYIFVVKFLIGFVAFMIFLFRFMKFPNFEAWNTATGLWITNNLYLVPWIAGFKLAISALLANRLLTSKLASPKAIAILVAAYIALVFVTAWISSHGLPFPNVTMLHWLSFLAIAVPLGRILGAPLLLADSRHQQ